jgi:acyl-CoA synthetase (AMP-forming)/AMP-acid ligase II
MSGELDMGAGSRALLPTPLFHVGALNIKNAQRWRHGTNIILRTSEASDIASAIHKKRANTMFLVPIQLQRLLDVADSATYDLTSINTINMAGAPIPVPLLRRGLERLGQVFVVQYGLTEAQCTTLYKHELAAEAIAPTGRLGSIGHVQPQSEIAILDEDGLRVPVGTVGEICFRGPSVMDGYWNNTAATLEAFRDGWLRTGDVGYMDDAEYVFLVDRRKDVIISGGENIYSREVEDVLHANDVVQEAAVIGVPDSRWGESVTAFVVLKQGAAATEDMIRATARASIAGYKCPKRVIFVDDLPRLPTGKVNKNFLRDSWKDARRRAEGGS